ncbi:hypothetical protein WJX75_006001 [Coccomyxa subellipsoidea]|uniref:Uncharacterized protein n=1 Tax=Coccomyxa subellipsoidea TaxID=248742 RepID=A0ABR2YCL2_9CHLO
MATQEAVQQGAGISARIRLPTSDDIRITAPNVALESFPLHLTKQCLLFYYPETEALARSVAETSQGRVELGDIKWAKFNDGFPNVFVKDATRIRNRHVAFLASFQDAATIFEQLSVIYQLPRMFVGSFTLVLPYFPTGTAERVEAEGDVATAVTLARILSNIPLSRGGPTSVVIFDIHALQERFYFGDTVLPLFESGIPLVRERMRSLPDADNITIAYPDEGAWKRFHYQFGDYPEVICTKVRDGDKRIVRLKEGSPKGRHVVIVDDLVQSGGTLIECQRLLKTQGAEAVSAYVTHGVFPKESWRRFTKANGTADAFKYFWITDSCPRTVQAIQGQAPYEVISLAGPIMAALQI